MTFSFRNSYLFDYYLSIVLRYSSFFCRHLSNVAAWEKDQNLKWKRRLLLKMMHRRPIFKNHHYRKKSIRMLSNILGMASGVQH
jgi:hypothetical protein